MEFREWEPYYKAILKDFGFDQKKDEESARILSKLLNESREKKVLKKIERKINEKRVYIVGPVLSLEEFDLMKGTIIAADEATSMLRKKGIVPNIIVTDLDGEIGDQLWANENGAIIIIHAHGDNAREIKKFVPLFDNVLGTTQSRPLENVYNFGGFTDGDRAFFLAEHFNAKEIILIGFDFDEPIQKEGKDLEMKKKKLKWARYLIQRL
jgi:hypothetical protein